MGSLSPNEDRNGQAAARNAEPLGNKISFILHNLPDLPSPPQIIGLCTVPAGVAGSDGLGYMVSDFLAWKYIMWGEGHRGSQIWLSSIDIPSVLADGCKLSLHSITSKPDGTRVGVDVSSMATEAQHQDLFKTVDKPSYLKAAFIEEIQTRSSMTKTLVIFVSGETTPEQVICFDKDLFMSRGDILRVSSPDALVVVVSAAPFSAGYQISYLNAPAGFFSRAQEVNIMAKHCGGAFANRLIKRMTSRDSPLLTEAQKKLPVFDDLSLISHSSPARKDLYARFHARIQSVLASQMTKTPLQHGFLWDAKADEWPLVKRVGPPLEVWGNKWARRATTPTTLWGEGFNCFGTAFGGTKLTQVMHLKFLAMLELKTCPGDWGLLSNGYVFRVLTNFVQGRDIDEEKCQEVLTLVEYRASCMILADVIIDILELPRPHGHPAPGEMSCRYWDFAAYGKMEEKHPQLVKPRVLAFGSIAHSIFPLPPVGAGLYHDKLKGVKFWRPVFYLASAIAKKFVEEGKGLDGIEQYINKNVREAFDGVFERQLVYLHNDKRVHSAGLAWIRSLDLEQNSAIQVETPGSTASRPAGIEGSQHAPNRLPMSYAPYFGMIVQDNLRSKATSDTSTLVAGSTTLGSPTPLRTEAKVTAPSTPVLDRASVATQQSALKCSSASRTLPAGDVQALSQALPQVSMQSAVPGPQRVSAAPPAAPVKSESGRTTSKATLSPVKSVKPAGYTESNNTGPGSSQPSQPREPLSALPPQSGSQSGYPGVGSKQAIRSPELANVKVVDSTPLSVKENAKQSAQRTPKQVDEKTSQSVVPAEQSKKVDSQDKLVEDILSKFQSAAEIEELVKKLQAAKTSAVTKSSASAGANPKPSVPPATVVEAPVAQGGITQTSAREPEESDRHLMAARQAWRSEVKTRDPELDQERKERCGAESKSGTAPKETVTIRPKLFAPRPTPAATPSGMSAVPRSEMQQTPAQSHPHPLTPKPYNVPSASPVPPKSRIVEYEEGYW